MPEHVLIPFAFALFALAFVVGPATSIAASTVRSAASVLAFGPALGAYLVMRPGEFEPSMIAQFSTSQLIGLGSAMIAAAFWSHLRSLMGGAPYTRPGEREGRKVAVEVVAPAEAA